MRRNVILGISLVLMLAVSSVVFAGGQTETAVNDKPVTLKLAVESAVGTPGDLSANDFKRIVEEKSGGMIKIEYYPAGQLGTGDDLTEAMQTGTVDMSWRVLDWYSKFENGWNILLLGFTFVNQEHLETFLASDKHAEFKDELIQKAGIRIISDNGIGSPRVLISKTPVTSPEDMKGMNMRVPGIAMYQKTWSSVGVNIVSVPWGEAYMALKQGVADALESPLGSIYGMKFFEAAKNITLTNHLFSPYVMALNENSFQRLSPELQQVLIDAAQEAGELFVSYDQESVNSRKQEMIDSGVQFIEEFDIDAFQAKVSSSAASLEQDGMWPEGLYDYIQGLK